MTRKHLPTESAKPSVSLEVIEIIGVLANDLQARGKIKEGTEKAIIEPLLQSLSRHKTEHILKALERHKEISPWFPAYADLMKFIQPMITMDERDADIKRRSRQSDKQIAEQIADRDYPKRSAEEIAKSQAMLDAFHKSAAALAAKDKPSKPFPFRQASKAELEKIHANNPLFDPWDKRY